MSLLDFKKMHILRRNVLVSLTRRYVNSESSTPIIRIPLGSHVYAFGTPSATSKPLISNLNWNVQETEAWAVVSGTGGGKGVLFKALLGHARVAPPTAEIQGQWAEAGGLYPFLARTGADPYTRVSYVSFRQRGGGESGAFFDYTARYGAIREEEDRVTLRDTLSANAAAEKQPELFDTLIKQMGLTGLLDIPAIALSNGQTRRARIVKAILDQPELLLLDEPLTGLDASSRKALNETLERLHIARAPRVIIGLRKGEEIPRWITNVLEIAEGAAIGREVVPSDHLPHQNISGVSKSPKSLRKELLVDMKNVNVVYGERKVLTDINWEIRRGDRWHLRGANGSGKTTLLALLSGDHPQSYVQAHLKLPALGGDGPLPRKKTPTAHLRRLIGIVSPEMFDAFPRRHPGMSVWEAVTTGFGGGFVPRTRDAPTAMRRHGSVGWVDVADEEVPQLDIDPEESRELLRGHRIARCREVLGALGPAAWSQGGQEATAAFASSQFSTCSPGEQRLVLLMRALVDRPPLILLDEVWSGMDDSMIAAARRYLRGEIPGILGVNNTQAVVVITHWEDEVPWNGEEVLRFTLG